MTDEIHTYWEEQAQTYKDSGIATNPDTYSHRKELEVFRHYLQDSVRLLEFGCGNGLISRGILRHYELSEYMGVDYSPAMIAECDKSYLANRTAFKTPKVGYAVGNVLTYQTSHPFDYVMTDRCLINLPSYEEQLSAVRNIHSALAPGGTFLMAECSNQSLANLNSVRAGYDLTPIPERWHNLYLDEERFLGEIRDLFTLESIDNFNSTYFLISRTLNAILTPPGEQADYLSPLNLAASRLPALGDYAPLKLFILKKK